jgi:hypothetical protein
MEPSATATIRAATVVAPLRRRPRLGRGPALIAGIGIMLLAAVLAARNGGVFEFAFPAAALGVALALYRVAPELYVGFAWWMWFVTPAVRRLVDYQVGWNLQSPILLTPLLVSGLAAGSALRHLRKLRRPCLFPFGLMLVGIVYGYGVGIIQAGPLAATYAMLGWLAPTFFGLHLAVHWERYPQYRSVTQQAFLWGVLVLGVYGVLQFFDPPAWDRFWMVNSQMRSIGSPEPRHVRVFSLLNSPGPFATVMAAGLLLLFASRRALWIPAAAVGFLAFMLSQLRAAWLCWLLGMIMFAGYLSARSGLRFVRMVIVLGLMIPFVVGESAAKVIAHRILTFRDLSGDASYRDRVWFLHDAGEAVFANPLGKGLGTTGGATLLDSGEEGIQHFDNGILEIFYSLGWVSGTLYMIGVLWLLWQSLRRVEGSDDLFAKAARAAAIATLATAAAGSVTGGVSGVILWGFFGLLTAAHQWHRVERTVSRY